jgi:integrase
MKARGLGRVYLRGQVWWAQYNYRGETYRESSGSTNRVDAVKLLRARLAEMGRGRLVGPGIERTTFEDLARILLDDYTVNQRKSIETASASVKALRVVFGPAYARDITLDRLNGYVSARLTMGRKPATIRNELAALKRAFHLAERAGKAICPLFPTLTVRNTRTGFFEEPEFRGVLVGLPAAIQPVAEFAYYTGWRKDEILTLPGMSVDFEAQVVRLDVGTTKNDEGRTFPFSVWPALGDLLRRQRELTTALARATGQIIPWVFHWDDGTRIRDFRGSWDSACIAAGFFRVVRTPEGARKATKLFHDFRRTAVRNLERAGVSRSVAMKLTGHKTEAVYRRYAIVSEADLLEGVKKLAALHAGAGSPARTVVPFPGRTSTVLAQSAGETR